MGASTPGCFFAYIVLYHSSFDNARKQIFVYQFLDQSNLGKMAGEEIKLL